MARMKRPWGRGTGEARVGPPILSREGLQRWVYVGRMTLVAGILLGALFAWGAARPEETFLATVMFVAALLVTAVSAWFTEVRRHEPGRNFLYAQVAFDVLLVTGVVHATGGAASNFAWLYILVISEGALLLPFSGGVLIGAFASILYFADIVWGHGGEITGPVALQISLFALVALVTGFIADRLRRAGIALGDIQSELRRLRLDTSEILSSISSGVVTVDEEGRLAYMNPAAETLLGLDARQWEGAPVLSAVEGVAPELARLLRRSLTEGGALLRHRAEAERNGDRIVLGVTTTSTEEEGHPRSVTAIFQDITDLERLELLNRRNERLEAVAELSAAMAHEIKNPLASIRSAVEQFASPSLEGQDREMLTRMVVRESERLSRLLSDFIDFARVRVGRTERIDLREGVHECLGVLESHPSAEEKRVRFVERAADGPAPVRCDTDLLHRAIFNLLLNAVHFSPEGGTVTVEVEDLRLRDIPAGVDVPNPIRLRVRDEGEGIAAEDLSRVFDPFFTTRPGGSGLGLAVVHRAVTAHKGVIFAEQAPGGGAEFILYLPGVSLSEEEGGG